ncbi:hypothetical protein ACNF49_14085 [Actinomadura sp. ATCC 39365]
MSATSVYQYFGAGGALLYIGVTDRGIRRTHEHAESKPWWPLTTGCTIEHYPNRDEALAREADLIRRFRPPFNQQHNPDRGKPIEERTANIGRPLQTYSGDASLKARKRAWYELPRHLRRVAPCVSCGDRPGGDGPTCLNCRQRKSA